MENKNDFEFKAYDIVKEKGDMSDTESSYYMVLNYTDNVGEVLIVQGLSDDADYKAVRASELEKVDLIMPECIQKLCSERFSTDLIDRSHLQYCKFIKPVYFGIEASEYMDSNGFVCRVENPSGYRYNVHPLSLIKYKRPINESYHPDYYMNRIKFIVEEALRHGMKVDITEGKLEISNGVSPYVAVLDNENKMLNWSELSSMTEEDK